MACRFSSVLDRAFKRLLLLFARVGAVFLFYRVFRKYRNELPQYIEGVRSGEHPLILNHETCGRRSVLHSHYEAAKGKTLVAAVTLLLITQSNPITARTLVMEYLKVHLRKRARTWRLLRGYFEDLYRQLGEVETLAETERSIFRTFASELHEL